MLEFLCFRSFSSKMISVLWNTNDTLLQLAEVTETWLRGNP